ncbi:MAG TPA: hypothetical protein IAD15_10490 [Candidatus Fimiplasma intestinipullorum]|uniref:Uncharacterized protein n=1 Tax=Candidatus Fimiplasma intestinipullorum TaxID=2840825 RepID=A0A9D1HQQ6_9FIRM|nr:hypothetical protein [Candidatus Fimiplasma intestinipullorum]
MITNASLPIYEIQPDNSFGEKTEEIIKPVFFSLKKGTVQIGEYICEKRQKLPGSVCPQTLFFIQPDFRLMNLS